MLKQISEENDKYRSMIQQIRQEKGFAVSPGEKKTENVNVEELDKLDHAVVIIEHKIKDQEKAQRKEVKQWDKQIKDKENRLVDLTRELKEREQENRISKLKIKEMKRLIKHNQLRPIG